MKLSAQKLPPLNYESKDVEAGSYEEDLYFPEIILGLEAIAALHREIGIQKNILESIIGITGFSDTLVTTLKDLGNRVMTYRRHLALLKNQEVAKMVSYQLDTHKLKKIILFGVHQNTITDLHYRLAKYDPLMYFQATQDKTKKRILKRFNGKNPYKYRLMIATIASMQDPIDLTLANEIMFVESSWDMYKNAQAIVRVHRYGQQNAVKVRFIGLKESSDAKLQRLIRSKTMFITGGKSLYTDTSLSELVVNPSEGLISDSQVQVE